MSILKNIPIRHFYLFIKGSTLMDDAINKIPEIELYNNLSNVESDYYYEYNNLRECPQCKNTYPLNLFIGKITKNYNAYEDKLNDESNNNSYCRYFMYWLYYEKYNYDLLRGTDASIWKECISCVWNKLENARTHPDKKCKFENDIDSYVIVQIKKTLDEICLIEKKKEDIISNMSDRDKCLNLNKLKHYYLHLLLLKISSIPDDILWNNKNFNLGNHCSIKKVREFLQEEQCPPEVIERCPEPKTCDETAPRTQENCTELSCPNLQQLCKEVYPPTTLECIEQVIKSDGQELTPDILKRLYPKFCTEKPQDGSLAIEEHQGNSHNIPYLQLPVTVLSSVVGTIFFFLFLYKVKDISF
ncbi:hypothetical protein PVBG_05804 [Plasmodium vivax Brazil I]|uniref:PIR Superfamily Protein n=1 Tax=Plasmodium vivax (strain Brazil I) TaxID=1033975 RepID=A0A0J9SZW7_PLAV1|nr:hypothetical protein PVBG_05804 [Plasmodium vivax Brazil I]